ncbi:MAG: hypothetical protein [Caudovirales sp. ctOwN3]|nr:MAG: hypothetical protein [Caudovirales sp. ctOwN3]
MGCKYVKEFEFGSDKGYTGSAGQTVVKGYARGGSCKKGYAKGGRVDPEVREAVHKHERNMHPKEPLTPMKKGGKVVEKATGEVYPSRKAMVKHEMMETPRMQKEEMMQKRMVKGPAMAAGRDPRAALLQPMAKGGKLQAKMGKVMHEFGKGELHSGKNGPVVKNPKQAIAIAYSEARKATKK